MVVAAAALIVFGVFCALMGQKLFRLLLPVVGFIAGVMVGFGGVQAVFGTGAVSLTIGIITALIVGALMAVLSFVFYHVAVVVLTAVLGASAFSFLGIALGLGDNGFILTLLGLGGAIVGAMFAASSTLSIELVFTLTAFLGVSYVMAGIMLLVGDINLDQLQDNGIVASVLQTVDQSFIWFFVWFGGSLMAASVQRRLAVEEFMNNLYAFTAETK